MARIAGVPFTTMLIVALAGAAGAQAPAAPAPEPPKTLREELVYFGYLENSYVVNLHGTRGGANELRVYDAEDGYTFNMGELSVKKEPSAVGGRRRAARW